jgi:hypothetical protein
MNDHLESAWRLSAVGVVHMLARFAFFGPLMLAMLLAYSLPVGAEVRLPNGEWVDRNEDLRVKVLGGYVVVERTWQAERQNQGEWRWHVNPAWARLTFKSEALADSSRLIAIGRAGATFERTGDDEPVFVFDKHYFIRERVEGGWRWYDRKGNWIHYDSQGYIEEYGDRNNVKERGAHVHLRGRFHHDHRPLKPPSGLPLREWGLERSYGCDG